MWWEGLPLPLYRPRDSRTASLGEEELESSSALTTWRIEAAPELYRAIAVWPSYFEAVWDELQHLAAYPPFRRRGRALYYYARSSSRFLAEPLEASREAMAAQGLSEDDLATVQATLDALRTGRVDGPGRV